MSTLVGYDSSSEEDETPKERPPSDNFQGANTLAVPLELVSDENGNPDTSVPATNPVVPENSTVEIGPMVGPAMPLLRETDMEQDIPRDSSSPFTERDAIRYLTQASHPMTSIPPSPSSSPDPALEAKFKRFLELKPKGVHFNDDLGSKSTFRNPTLLSTLMSRAGLESEDQYKTSLPLSLWNPLDFPPYAFKEELLRSQQSFREQEQATKKGLAAAGKRTIDFTSAGTSGHNSRDPKPGISSKRKRG